jgi:hypothetical protein
MSGEGRDQWLSEALATRDLERVQPNVGELDADHIRTAADAAERIVNAIATVLATAAKRA